MTTLPEQSYHPRHLLQRKSATYPVSFLKSHYTFYEPICGKQHHLSLTCHDGLQRSYLQWFHLSIAYVLRNGGWILDRLPVSYSMEHWTKLLEKNTVVRRRNQYTCPTEVTDGDILTQHWYQCRRPFIDDVQRIRLTQEYLKKVIADR